jgi:hypothetical protein
MKEHATGRKYHVRRGCKREPLGEIRAALVRSWWRGLCMRLDTPQRSRDKLSNVRCCASRNKRTHLIIYGIVRWDGGIGAHGFRMAGSIRFSYPNLAIWTDPDDTTLRYKGDSPIKDITVYRLAMDNLAHNYAPNYHPIPLPE